LLKKQKKKGREGGDPTCRVCPKNGWSASAGSFHFFQQNVVRGDLAAKGRGGKNDGKKDEPASIDQAEKKRERVFAHGEYQH